MASKINFINTDQAPAAVGPYSQAVEVGESFYLSGQIGLDPATGQLVSGGLEAQVKQIFNNIKAVLLEADLDLNRVVMVSVFMTDLGNFELLNSIYQTEFQDHKPARQTIEVKALPKAALVEISVIAVR